MKYSSLLTNNPLVGISPKEEKKIYSSYYLTMRVYVLRSYCDCSNLNSRLKKIRHWKSKIGKARVLDDFTKHQ